MRVLEVILMFEYKFVEVPFRGSAKGENFSSFDRCKEIINEEAAYGWRLKQLVMPASDKAGMYVPAGYQIIFEREA